MEALKQAKIKSIAIDEHRKAVQVTVDEDQLSLAIGRRGQNARLTSRLTGWGINISKDETVTHAFEQKLAQAITTLAQTLNIDEETARSWARAGTDSLDGKLQTD